MVVTVRLFPLHAFGARYDLPAPLYLFLIGVPLSIAVIGNYWPYISPLNVVARAVGAKSRIEWNTSWGYWPATILFFLFACGELVFNGVTTTPAGTAQVLLAYGIVNAVMAYLFGAETWLRRGEVFSVLFATWGRLGYFRFGTPGTRGFFGGLHRPFEASVSRLTFVLMLLVSVSFDGLLATPAWKNFVSQLPESLHPGAPAYTVLLLVVFVALVGVLWGLFSGFAAAVL